MAKKRDWERVLLDIQLREIPVENTPRLLFECILDLQKSRGTLRDISTDITSTIGSLKATVEHIGNSDGPE